MGRNFAQSWGKLGNLRSRRKDKAPLVKNVRVAGEFQGKLKNSGKIVGGLDLYGKIALEALYWDNVEGLTEADGGGASLHRKIFDPRATSWTAGTPAPGSLKGLEASSNSAIFSSPAFSQFIP